MRKFLALSAFLLLLAAGFLPQGEAAQFFAQHYTFTAEGQLQPPLSVEFVKGDVRPISAVLAGLHDGAKVMTLAYHEHGQIALYSFQKGNQYVLYRLRFRENQEDLLILSYGPRGAGKTELRDLSVIGADVLENVRPLPIAGFQPVAVFNSPLQIRKDEAILFLDRAPKVLSLKWDAQAEQYVVSGIL